MSDPVQFIDAEKLLAKVEQLDERLARIEGALEAIAAALGVTYTPPDTDDPEEVESSP